MTNRVTLKNASAGARIKQTHRKPARFQRVKLTASDFDDVRVKLRNLGKTKTTIKVGGQQNG